MGQVVYEPLQAMVDQLAERVGEIEGRIVLRWSRELPMEAGWYWFLDDCSSTPTILAIQRDQWGGEKPNGKWAGPLLEPID